MYRWLLSCLLCAWPMAAMAVPYPFLFTILPHASALTRQNNYFSVSVDESVALRAAVPGGGMWVPLPTGTIHLDYRKSVVHRDGTWTWIGGLSNVPNAPKALITFGDHAVFGTIPTTSGKAWRLATFRGGVQLAAPTTSRDGARPERITQVVPNASRARSASIERQQAVSMPRAATVGTPSTSTIDLMVLYTSGFQNMYGSASAALARIQHEVDLLNQAFEDSKVYGRVRLVHVAEVAYPDAADDADALSDLRNGIAPLDSVPAMRTQYGVDEVALIRAFTPGSYSCSSTYIMGYNLAPITSTDASRAFLVLDDDADGSCFPVPGYGLTEVLGSNYGLRNQNATGTPGPYPFSYAYQVAESGHPFPIGTLMADGNLEGMFHYFSNPNLNLCNGPCGVPNQSDAARSLNLTLPTVAAFEPTKVENVHDDVNADGKADLIWRSNDNAQFAYWIMNGTQLASSFATSTSTNYRIAATGDFNGDGKMDVIWSDGTNLLMWAGDGTSFTSTFMRPYPVGWAVVGTGDFDGDGNTDIVWTNGNQVAEWLMDGPNFKASDRQALAKGWRCMGIGDFDGDGRADLLLTNGNTMQMWTAFNNGSFTAAATHAYPVGWSLLGAGDVDGDGMTDLLWRDNTHTHFAYWAMDGVQLAKSWEVAVTPEWTFGSSGDFNGDGLLDLVWYNRSQIVMWSGVSTGIYKGALIHGYPTGWTMLH